MSNNNTRDAVRHLRHLGVEVKPHRRHGHLKATDPLTGKSTWIVWPPSRRPDSSGKLRSYVRNAENIRKGKPGDPPDGSVSPSKQ